ncbi:MAG: diphosphomevalonate decarboxylase [Bdellovibrionota bacterium]|nr:diphosphomevalonate decarboxylase [Bdellovibrionota bacterium]
MIKETAPSNIALIKYMGKEADNIPSNPSLSYSLPHLLTSVQISKIEASEDQWRALESEYAIELSEKGKARYLKFFKKLKDQFGLKSSYLIESANNFPSDAGLASSASSFAALTKATYSLAKAELSTADFQALGFTGEFVTDREKLSALSRTGSGSSCRSLFDKWSEWQTDFAVEENFAYANLLHLAIIAEEDKKEVSSSDAHIKVKSSLLMEGRTARANKRLADLKNALNEKSWEAAFEICWAEFWDMHALFETSEPSFGYMTSDSLMVLNECRTYWKANQDGPLVTMDAGPNVHLLFRDDQRSCYEDFVKIFENKFKIWGSES